MNPLLRALLTIAATLPVASTVCAAETIIVYRSRAEAEMDAFWWDHPEVVLWGVGALVVVAAVMLYRNRRR